MILPNLSCCPCAASALPKLLAAGGIRFVRRRQDNGNGHGWKNTEEARERGRKGGVASGQARRQKRALREYLEARLEIMTGDVSTAEAITAALVDKALSGDMRAYETIRDTLGQNPRQMVETEVSGGLGLHHEVTPVVGALLARLVKEEEGQA